MQELFTLADRLRDLRAEKDDFSAKLKDLNAEIDVAEHELSDAMAEAECSNFTRGDRQFILTTTTRWSAEPERKEELYTALRENGYEHLFSVNPQTLGSFVREQVNVNMDETGEPCVPDWLSGLVKKFDDTGITMRSAAKKS